MTVRVEVGGLQPMALIEMYVFDPTNVGQPSTAKLFWHPGTQVDRDPITWQGVSYNPYPVEGTGFDITSSGKLPRPTLRAANIGGTLGQYLRSMDDGLGAKIVRKRTYAKFLDAVNFHGGNVYANPNAHFDDEIYYLARKANENPIFIEYELAVAFDVSGIQLPRRQVIAGTCQWKYRDPECSYTGPAVTDPVYGAPVGGVDKCGKTLASCRARFGVNGRLPTSAFPASMLARYNV